MPITLITQFVSEISLMNMGIFLELSEEIET